MLLWFSWELTLEKFPFIRSFPQFLLIKELKKINRWYVFRLRNWLIKFFARGEELANCHYVFRCAPIKGHRERQQGPQSRPLPPTAGRLIRETVNRRLLCKTIRTECKWGWYEIAVTSRRTSTLRTGQVSFLTREINLCKHFPFPRRISFSFEANTTTFLPVFWRPSSRLSRIKRCAEYFFFNISLITAPVILDIARY